MLTDIDHDQSVAVAEAIGSELEGSTPLATTIIGMGLDVSDRAATSDLVGRIDAEYGPIDLWCANAGVGTLGGVDAEPAAWQHTWDVNVMAHVHATAALLPGWLERGSGHLLVTASAAGLLTNLGDAPYSVTKHAAVAFAEWVAITHGGAGIGVTCLCPQGVRTPMVFGAAADEFAHLRDPGTGTESDPGPSAEERDDALALSVVRDKGIIEPADVAAATLDALRSGRFLALPHPEVERFERNRAGDHDRWIIGMRKLQAQLDAR